MRRYSKNLLLISFLCYSLLYKKICLINTDDFKNYVRTSRPANHTLSDSAVVMMTSNVSGQIEILTPADRKRLKILKPKLTYGKIPYFIVT